MMNFFSKNIVLLRKNNNKTQAEICASLDFKRNTWSNWENGVSSPDLETLAKIASYFNVDFGDIVQKDLSKPHLSENELNPILQANTHPKPHLNTHLNTPNQTIKPDLKPNKMVLNEADSPYRSANMPAVVTVAPDGAENIVYVPIKAQAGYLIGHGDTSFIESLPTFHMPGLRNATYRMFEVEGLSMSPTLQDKDRVIAEWVPSVSEIRENRCHVVLTKDGVLVKRLLNRVEERGKIYLKSDTLTHRHEHPIKEIDPSDILEIWYVRLKVSSDLSEPGELYTRVSDLEINMLQIMKQLELSKK